jgi:hypothetical protein
VPPVEEPKVEPEQAESTPLTPPDELLAEGPVPTEEDKP